MHCKLTFTFTSVNNRTKHFQKKLFSGSKGESKQGQNNAWLTEILLANAWLTEILLANVWLTEILLEY